MSGEAQLDRIETNINAISGRILRLRASKTVSRDDVKRVLVTPLIDALGWSIYDPAEVKGQFRYRTSDRDIDYALFIDNAPKIFLAVSDFDEHIPNTSDLERVFVCARNAEVGWCIFTDGAKFKIYATSDHGPLSGIAAAQISLETPEKIRKSLPILSMLTKSSMEIGDLNRVWKQYNIDIKVKSALTNAITDHSVARALSRLFPQISVEQIQQSLERAKIDISFDNPFDIAPCLLNRSSVQVSTADLNLNATSKDDIEDSFHLNSAVGLESGSETGCHESPRRFQLVQDLFELGRLKTGEILTIRGYENSAAEVADGNTVYFNGERMSYRDWGMRVTKWSSIQIYVWAYNSEGVSLDQLRDQPQQTA